MNKIVSAFIFFVLSLLGPSYSYGQAQTSAMLSTGGTPSNFADEKQTQGVIEFFSKTVTKNITQETIKAFEAGDFGFNFLLTFFVLLSFGVLIRDQGLDNSTIVKEGMYLAVAFVIVGSCLNPGIYANSGLKTVMTPAGGSSNYLDVDFVLRSKEVADEAAVQMFGADLKSKFEDARAGVFSALITGKNPEEQAAAAQAATAAKVEKDKEEPGIISKAIGADKFAVIIGVLEEVIANPVGSILKFFLKILDVVYIAGLFLAMTLFSLQFGVSILLFKLIVAFGIFPAYRTRIWTAYKIPLSFALYEFVNKLLLFVQLILFSSLSKALATLDAGTRVTVAIPLLAFTVFIIAAQIAAIIKIPHIAKSLLNLSLEELPGLAGTIIKSVGAITGVAATALPAAGSFLAGLKSTFGNVASNVGGNARDLVNQRRTENGLSAFQGAITAPNGYPNPYAGDRGGKGGPGGGFDSGGSPVGGGGMPGGPSGSGGAGKAQLGPVDNLKASIANTDSVLKNRPTSTPSAPTPDSQGPEEAPEQDLAGDAPQEEASVSMVPPVSMGQLSQMAPPQGSDQGPDSVLKSKASKPESEDERLMREEAERQKASAENLEKVREENAKEEYLNYLRAKEERRKQRAADAAARRAQRNPSREDQMIKSLGTGSALGSSLKDMYKRNVSQATRMRLRNTAKNAAPLAWGLTKLAGSALAHSVGATMKMAQSGGDINSIANDLKTRAQSLNARANQIGAPSPAELERRKTGYQNVATQKFARATNDQQIDPQNSFAQTDVSDAAEFEVQADEKSTVRRR